MTISVAGGWVIQVRQARASLLRKGLEAARLGVLKGFEQEAGGLLATQGVLGTRGVLRPLIRLEDQFPDLRLFH